MAMIVIKVPSGNVCVGCTALNGSYFYCGAFDKLITESENNDPKRIPECFAAQETYEILRAYADTWGDPLNI